MTRTYGYQPTSNATPGTPPNEPAGASSANRTRLAITGDAVQQHVLIDGHDISRALTGCTLSLAVGQVPTARLDLRLIDATEIQDAETRILIPDATRDTLIALGWTPPAAPEQTTDHD